MNQNQKYARVSTASLFSRLLLTSVAFQQFERSCNKKTADKFKKFPIFLKWSNKSSLSILNPKIAELYDNLWRCATASKSSNFLCVKRHKNRFWFSSLDLNLHSWIFQMCAKFLFLEAIGISSTNLIKKYFS